MQLNKAQILKIQASFKLEYVLNMIVIIMIVICMMMTLNTLLKPVSQEDFNEIHGLAVQESYPKTQKMAKSLMQHQPIQTVDYFRLIRAYHYESSHIKRYPAEKISSIP